MSTIVQQQQQFAIIYMAYLYVCVITYLLVTSQFHLTPPLLNQNSQDIHIFLLQQTKCSYKT